MGVGRAGVWMSHGEGREAPHPGKEASRAHEGITRARDSQETAQLSVAWNNQLDVSLTDSLSRSSTRHPPGARTGGTEGASGKGRPRRSEGGTRGQDQPRRGQASEKVEKHYLLGSHGMRAEDQPGKPGEAVSLAVTEGKEGGTMTQQVSVWHWP